MLRRTATGDRCCCVLERSSVTNLKFLQHVGGTVEVLVDSCRGHRGCPVTDGTFVLHEVWHPPECKFNQTKSGCKFRAECSFPHWKVEEQPNKKPKKSEDKSVVVIVKSVRQLCCVSHDTEPPDSTTISWKGKRVSGPVRRVRFTRAALCQANIREKEGPSLGKIQVQIPHQRSPYAMKFEDRSPGETARQERCARGDAWEFAKTIFKLKKGRQSHILFTF